MPSQGDIDRALQVIKDSRYGVVVPKPKARLNMGDWHRYGENAKFGYRGVSVQSEDNLFIDVGKTVAVQTRGSYVELAKDLLSMTRDGMTFATSDNATVAADGLATLVAGAGQAPSYASDHGDSLDTYPYFNLQYHYRVEEIQNGLFDFFRGR